MTASLYIPQDPIENATPEQVSDLSMSGVLTVQAGKAGMGVAAHQGASQVVYRSCDNCIVLKEAPATQLVTPQAFVLGFGVVVLLVAAITWWWMRGETATASQKIAEGKSSRR